MKFPGVILFMLLSSQLFAQHNLNGFVLDKANGLPISNATVKKGYATQLTAYDGYFNIASTHFGDTIKIISMGYKPYNLIIGMLRPDTVRVYLEENSIMLNNVTVNSQRNHLLDSMNTRKEFAKIFAYKAPTIADAFLTVDPYAYHPSNYIIANNSTASLVGIDMLSVVGLFVKNKAPDYKLKQLALQDEDAKYVDRRFSKQKITSITGLQGDQLRQFIDQYRPLSSALKTMSDYDVIIYIKKSYAEFSKTGKQGDKSPFAK